MAKINNTRILFLISLLLAFLMVGSASAISCGTEPAGVIACQTVNVVVTTSTGTSGNFILQFPNAPVNMLAGNYLPYNTLSGKTLPCWVESNTMFWCNMEANTIAGDSSFNGILAIGEAASGVNYFLFGNNLGEAPQYTTPYGKYDNGANVFKTFYSNLASNSLWTKYGTGNTVFANGLTLDPTGFAWLGEESTTKIFGGNVIDDYVSNGASGTAADCTGGYTSSVCFGAVYSVVILLRYNSSRQNGG